MVHNHRRLEHRFAFLAWLADLAAQQAKASRELDLDHPRRPRALFVELARTRLLQSRARLHPSADRALVPRPASASHASRMSAYLPSMFIPAAVCARGNDLAVVSNDSVAGQQWSVLAHHAAFGRRSVAADFESLARISASVSGNASLRRLDRCVAVDWRTGRRARLGIEDSSGSASSARLSARDWWIIDRCTRRRRGPVVWFFDGLLNHARPLLHRRDCARPG